ncbi:cytochrome c oxidase subunit 3, partial [Armadillidium vulgare]
SFFHRVRLITTKVPDVRLEYDHPVGSTFFVATGFHGLLVLIGTTFLLICFIRLFKAHFSPTLHFGFEAAVWY